MLERSAFTAAVRRSRSLSVEELFLREVREVLVDLLELAVERLQRCADVIDAGRQSAAGRCLRLCVAALVREDRSRSLRVNGFVVKVMNATLS